MKRHNRPRLGEGSTTLTSKGDSATKQGYRFRYWTFTFFDYEDREDEFKKALKQWCTMYNFIHEKCPTTDKQHLQGFIKLKDKKGKRMTELKKKFAKEIHWESAKSDFEANMKYTTKEGGWDIQTYFSERQLELITNLYPWQAQVIKIIESEPDNRTIHWIYNDSGNAGKTALCKYLYAKHNAIIATKGEYSDLAQILAGEVAKGRCLNEKTIVAFNYGKSVRGISYAGLESIKDGLMTSPKYESQTIVFNSPHLLVFSNKLPAFEKMNYDRWCVWELTDVKLEMKRIRYYNNCDYEEADQDAKAIWEDMEAEAQFLFIG